VFRDGSHKTISTRSLKSPLENGQAWIPITVFLQYRILLIDSCLILCLQNSNQRTLLADFSHCPLTRQNVRAMMAAFRNDVKMMFMRFLFNDFKSCYSLFKVLHIFPSRYLFAIGFPSIFSFRRCISPNLDSIPKEPDSWEVSVSWKKYHVRGFNTLWHPIPWDLCIFSHFLGPYSLQLESIICPRF